MFVREKLFKIENSSKNITAHLNTNELFFLGTTISDQNRKPEY